MDDDKTDNVQVSECNLTKICFR